MNVVRIGAVCVEEQMLLGCVPSADQKEHAESLRYQVGGPVPVALMQLAQFGCKAGLLLAVGDDSNRLYLQRAGVTLFPAGRRPENASGVAQVWVNTATGSRTIFAHAADWEGISLWSVQQGRSECELLHMDCSGGDLAIAAA